MRKIKFEKGKIYHIFNRGVEKRNIFNNDSDKWRFLQGVFLFNDDNVSASLLWNLAREKGKVNFPILVSQIKQQKNRKPLVKIMADCLMPNHFHLLLEEIEENGISRFMQKVGVGYTKYFNQKYKRVGSLFQGPFKAVAVEKDLQLQYLLVYFNLINPGQLIEPRLKEIGVNNIDSVMEFAEKYPWSTHQEYLGKRDSIIIDKGILKDFFADPIKYQEFAKDILIAKRYDAISHLLLE